METDTETDALPAAVRGCRDVLDEQFVAYLRFEHLALRRRTFQPQVVPGLLQTRQYADRLIRATAPTGTSEDTMARQLQARMARQAIFDQPDSPETVFLVDEAVLRRQVDPGLASQQVMREQVAHLRQVAARPSVTVKVLPLDRSINHGLMGGFVALELPGPPGRVVFVERWNGSVLTNDAPQVHFYAELFATLAEQCIELDDVPA